MEEKTSGGVWWEGKYLSSLLVTCLPSNVHKMKLRRRTKAFLALIFLEFGVLVAFTVTRMIEGNEETFKRGFVYLFIYLFLGYFGLEGVIEENPLQLFSFILANIILAFFASVGFINENLTPIYYVQFSIVIFLVLLNLVLAFFVYRTFGWKIYKRVGADVNMLRMYKTYQYFVSVLKMDLFLLILGVSMIGLFLFEGYELYLDIGFILLSIFWAAYTIFIVRTEYGSGMVLFFGFAVVEPTYIIAKYIIVSIIDTQKYTRDDVVPVLILGFFALCCRAVLIVLGFLVTKNFGNGLREYFHKEDEDRTDYEAVPIFVEDENDPTATAGDADSYSGHIRAGGEEEIGRWEGQQRLEEEEEEVSSMARVETAFRPATTGGHYYY
jgi:hypothetical protein